MSQITLKIKRQEPGKPPEVKDYTVDVPAGASVMEAIIQARNENDNSLSVRANCMTGMCGDCGYRCNGESIVACTHSAEKVAKAGVIQVEPLRNINVVKDLVFDMDQFIWNKLKAVQPGLATNGAAHTEERHMDATVADDLQNAMSCYQCGLCDEGCVVINVDKQYLGPAAITRAYANIADPSDKEKSKRLDLLEGDHGVWDCAHCFEANGHCPRNINPTYRIFAVRDEMIKRGIKNSGAGRHHNSFVASVKQSGWLDEGRIAVESIGFTNIPGLMAFLPTAITALRRGKAPIPYIHHKRPGSEAIGRIIERAEKNREKAEHNNEQ